MYISGVVVFADYSYRRQGARIEIQIEKRKECFIW